MRALVLIALFLVSSTTFGAEPVKDDDAPIKRASQVSDHGMELFSWYIKADESWHFALLPAPGIDKLKSIDVETSKENAIDSVAALKKRLSALAVGEKVGWFNMLDKRETQSDDKRFDYPPKEIIKELELYCTVLKIRLNIYQPGKKK